jgi:hypothetical protein
MSNIHDFAVAVEQPPEICRVAVGLRVGVTRVISQFAHYRAVSNPETFAKLLSK